MNKIKIKNLDQLYSLLKSESGNLKSTGWRLDSPNTVEFSQASTLLGWMLINISQIKAGCNDLLVARSTCDSEYHTYDDHLYLSAEMTSMGLLVLVTTVYYTDNGVTAMTGDYREEKHKRQSAFLLKLEE